MGPCSRCGIDRCMGGCRRVVYKFRAECRRDIDEFLRECNKCDIIIDEHHVTQIKKPLPDLELEFSTTTPFESILSALKRVEDGHVMVETFARRELYTPKRRDPRDSVRLDLTKLAEFHDRNTGPNGECGWCGGEMKGIHKIITRADGVAISCAGADAMLLAKEIRSLRFKWDALCEWLAEGPVDRQVYYECVIAEMRKLEAK